MGTPESYQWPVDRNHPSFEDWQQAEEELLNDKMPCGCDEGMHYCHTNEEGWDAVSQGFYDDDPNPYHGDYSEM